MQAAPLRLQRVRQQLAAHGVDAVVVGALANIRSLCGFTGSNGWLFIDSGSVVLLTDGRYRDQATHECAWAGVAVSVHLTAAALHDDLVSRMAGHQRVGIEAAHVSLQQHTAWCHSLAQRNASTELVSLVGMVEFERRDKTSDELAAIERACSIADQALADVAPYLLGLTEAEARNRLDARLRELGASGPSYDTIVATGPMNGAKPHHRPTDTVIEPGHLVVIDVGALVEGYHSDMTRTFVAGEPTDEQMAMYHLVCAAQAAGLAALRAGVSAREVDLACRRVIDDAGYGDWFSHGTGHGVGLDIHEEPFLGRASDAILQVGDVVTIEPGVYREGFGGIRVEDLVVITSDGYRMLTASAKDSPCLPSPPTT